MFHGQAFNALQGFFLLVLVFVFVFVLVLVSGSYCTTTMNAIFRWIGTA